MVWVKVREQLLKLVDSFSNLFVFRFYPFFLGPAGKIISMTNPAHGGKRVPEPRLLRQLPLVADLRYLVCTLSAAVQTVGPISPPPVLLTPA